MRELLFKSSPELYMDDVENISPESESYKENSFCEVSKREDLHEGNSGYSRFIDHKHKVNIKVCDQSGMVKAAQKRINKATTVALVSKVISASNLKDGEVIGWGEHVGLNEGDILLYVNDQWLESSNKCNRPPSVDLKRR